MSLFWWRHELGVCLKPPHNSDFWLRLRITDRGLALQRGVHVLCVCVYTCARVCPRCLPFVYPQVHPSGVILLKSLPFTFYAKARTLSQMSPEPHLPPPGLHFTGHFLPLISCSL